MTYWEKYISEEMTAAQKKKAAEEVISDLTGKKKKKKKKGKSSEYTEYLKKQLEYKKQKYEDQKKRQIEKLKEKSNKETQSKVKSALSSIKYDTISHKDQDATAYKKAIGNVGSAVAGIGKAAYEVLKSRREKKKAEQKAAEAAAKQPDKKEPGKPGRPKASGEVKNVSVRDVTEKKPTSGLSGTPERKKLVPSTKRLPPASKKIAPSGGAPYQAEPAPQRETGMRLGQRARRNPALKSALIKTRMENYSDWREEFLFEVEGKANKLEKEKIIDVMKGKNKIQMNPTVTEDHKEIASGKKKDDEGYMANVELDQMERAIKALRKKVKRSDIQLPAWVQSKITRAADYIDTASEYLQSDETLDEENINEIAPAIAAIGRVALGAGSRTAATTGTRAVVSSTLKDIAKEKLKARVQNSLDRAGQRVQSSSDSIDPEEGEASAYKKALSNIVGEEVDKKKILMLMVLKALEDKKRRKNSQLINGIIGESKKSEMKCNKPKAEAHGSGETGKSHVVKACEGGKEKLIRFGQLGVKGSPKKEGESEEYASRRHRFQTRHAKNIAKGKMSAAYWANKVKW